MVGACCLENIELHETGLQLLKQFANSWNLPCCQGMETSSHASSTQNIYTPVLYEYTKNKS